MGKAAFEASLADGMHQALARMAGEWEGSYRLWFEPGEPAGQGRQRGSLRSVAGGRFLLHEYSGDSSGDPFSGVALYGYHLDRRAWESAWVDSFHTGTAILSSAGTADDPRLAVLTDYGDGLGGPEWGWRTEIEQPADDHIVITMFNIAPNGDEAKAVETDYRRVR